MIPYRITAVVRTTYSGKKHEVAVESDYMTDPIRVVKERLLDWFCSRTKQADPFVRIDIKTTTLSTSNGNIANDKKGQCNL